MKILKHVLILFAFSQMNAQLTANPDTLSTGKYNQIIFSGSSITFSQSSCIEVFLVQGTQIIEQLAGSFTGSNQYTALFDVASNLTYGQWDVYFVDMCSGSATTPIPGIYGKVVLSAIKKMTVRAKASIDIVKHFFDFLIYPNPTKDKHFTVQSPNNISSKNQLDIRNLQGAIVHSESFHQSYLEVQIPNLAKGIYFVEIYNEKGEKSSKKIEVE